MASDLRACPFCRELFTPEEDDVCPECDIVLRPLHELPPSYELREADAVKWERTPPEDRLLPATYWRRGRGVLLVTSLLGLALFFAPWIELTKPDIVTYSGWTLVSTRGFWFGGGAIGWFLCIPLVFTRRTVNQMRGVRIITTFFAAITALQCLFLLLNAPTSTLVPVAYSWGWGFYASIVVSLLAVPFAARFGGSIQDTHQDLDEKPATKKEPASSEGQTLH